MTKAAITRLTDDRDPDKITGYCAEIRIHCTQCGLPFEFVGCPGGLSPNQPMTSPDATELRAPLRPSRDPAANAQVILQKEAANNVDELNRFIKSEIKQTGGISDGYHTFDELYEMRSLLWMALCKMELRHCAEFDVIRTRRDNQKIEIPGWFLLCVNRLPSNEQISFHLPKKYWDLCDFALTRDYNRRYDGHTSAQVTERISLWCGLEKPAGKP